MGKFVIAKDYSFKIDNYEKNNPIITVRMPTQYTCLDILDIIRIYGEYEGIYDFDFFNTYDNEYFSKKFGHKNFDNVIVTTFQGKGSSAICSFGPLKIYFGYRGHYKWSKVYPISNLACGKYPSEKEFTNLGKISPKERITYKEDTLKEFNEKLKLHFKNKYKITDEIYDPIFNSNKLEKIKQ